MLEMLNRRMYSARLDGRFIAMLFAVYDAAAQRLLLGNAGGPYPLLVRDGRTEEIRLEGVPLGLFPASQYDQESIELRTGDVVLFASDGILESENARAEEFGSVRLHALLSEHAPQVSATALADRIIAATDEHSNYAANPHDDRTLLVLRVTGDGTADFSKLPVIY
jgi:phosphoserine phosphatase RsbU/P